MFNLSSINSDYEKKTASSVRPSIHPAVLFILIVMETAADKTAAGHFPCFATPFLREFYSSIPSAYGHKYDSLPPPIYKKIHTSDIRIPFCLCLVETWKYTVENAFTSLTGVNRKGTWYESIY